MGKITNPYESIRYDPTPQRNPMPNEVDPEIRKLRNYLAYAIVHAESQNRKKIEALQILADDPLIGSDYPAFVMVADLRAKSWKLYPYLVEAALGRPIGHTETPEDALKTLCRIMTEGDG